MSQHYSIQETGIMLQSMPAGSFDLHVAWVGNSFRVLVKTAESGEVIFFRSYIFADNVQFKDALIPLKEIVSIDLLFANQFRTTKIGLQGRSELYPTVFYTEEEPDKKSQLLHHLPIKVVQPIVVAEIEFYDAFFPKGEYHLLSAAWLDLILPYATPEKLFVEINHQLLYVAYAKSPDELIFFNSFEFKTVEDFAYFTNLVTTELKLDRANLSLVFSGDMVRESRLYDIAFAYFQKVEFLAQNTLIYSSLFHQFLRHQHLPILSL